LIVAEAEAPGAIISHVARRHHISRGLLSNWRQQVRRGALVADDHSAVFMPVQMLPEPRLSSPAVPVLREWAWTSGWWRYAGLSRSCAGDPGPFGGPRLARGAAHRHAARHERIGAPGAASVAARSARGGSLRVPGQARPSSDIPHTVCAPPGSSTPGIRCSDRPCEFRRTDAAKI